MLTLFEAGGIGVVGGSLRRAGLALASMKASSAGDGGDADHDDDVLGGVNSCAF